jgi:hypothetical protein
MAVVIAERFAAQCSVVNGNSYDTCGTLTRSDVAHLTPTQLRDLFTVGGLFADMDAWFRTQVEMKACGIKTNGMFEWIMSGADRGMGKLLNVQNVQKGPGLLYPFILGKQNSVINTDFWAITLGSANSAYTAAVTGPLTTAQKALGAADDRVVRVVNRYGVDLDAKWFVDRDRVHIFTRTAGAAEDGQWKVLAAAVDPNLQYIDVLVTSENAGSSGAFNATPTSGVLLPGINNVNDFEQWCNNRPTIDPRKRVPFWIQTRRHTRCIDSEYRKIYARLLEANNAFREFGDLDLAERNRQDEELAQKQFVHAFFFNKAISANQTLALWQSLEDIQTVTSSYINSGTGGKTIAKRANFVGVKEQLRQCDRYTDMGNQPLNWYEFLDENYQIMRARKSQGRTVTDIDWFTDSTYATRLMTAYLRYLKQESVDMLVLDANLKGSSDKYDFGFFWRSFLVKRPAGVRINIITHEFFDDMVSAFDAEGIASRGRMLLALDMGKPGPKGGTIYWSQIATNRKNHTVGKLEELARIDRTFQCVMENVESEVALTSETGTAIVECPANSRWIENLADTDPIITGRAYPYGDLV